MFLSGIQALVRMLLDQHRADVAAGRRTAVFASGYPGSPLGGFDRELQALGALAERFDVVHRPAVNEELGATAVFGSQLANSLPDPRFDGVVGVWYGKTPGVDRASDALRHANYGGSSPTGGMVALCGDDPEAKSSTLPSVSEPLLAGLHIPVLVPGSVQELLDLGRHAISCSRASGLWTAIKVNTIVADAHATAVVGPDRIQPVMPEVLDNGVPYVHQPSGQLLTPYSLEMERTLYGVRTELAGPTRASTASTRSSSATGPSRIGVVASGAGYHQLIEALDDLDASGGGPDPQARHGQPARRRGRARVRRRPRRDRRRRGEGPVRRDRGQGRALRIGPPAARDRRARRPRRAARPGDRRAVARRDRPRGRHGGCSTRTDLPHIADRLAELDAIAQRPAVVVGPARTPHFCSGCPHSVSTRAPDDALVGAGIGCHTMIMLTTAGRGTDRRRHPDGRRGCAVDRHRAVHRAAPPAPEPRRRHLPPLGLAGDPRRDRREPQRHLQAALQPDRRHDRRPDADRPDERRRDRARDGGRGRQADHRHDRGPAPLRRRLAAGDRRRARPLAADGSPGGAGGRSTA